MWSWFTFFLILHILAVFVAFGPAFAYPLIGRMMAGEPQYAPILTRVIATIDRRMTLPLSIAVPFLGLGLIYTGHFDLWKSEWLLIAIVLYIAAFFVSVFILLPSEAQLVAALQSMPERPSGDADGPPPHLAPLIRRVTVWGGSLNATVVVILVLMVWRPGSCQGIC